MKSMSSDIKGWDLIYRIIVNDINKKEDILIALIHITLINCDYACIGLGEHKDKFDEKSSELLPPDWNKNKGSYGIRYIKNGELYILKALVAEDIVVNFLNVQNLVVNSVAFNVSNTVKSLKGETLKDLIPKEKEVMKKIQSELTKFDSLKEATTQTNWVQPECKTEATETSRLLVDRSSQSAQTGSINVESELTFDYGHVDIDPIDRGRGGMILNPPISRQHPVNHGLGGPGQQHIGVFPPGLHFDPTVPPDIEGRRRMRFPSDSEQMPPNFDAT